jgi:ParB family chromosome partitioning protein
MSIKKPALGRGLGALLGDAVARQVIATAQAPQATVVAPVPVVPTPAPAPAVATVTPTGDRLVRLPLDLLQRGKYQPRADMRSESLEELAGSIRAQGVIQPIVVRPLGPATEAATQRYEIIAGERRWRAAQIAGLTDIPAVVRHVPDEAAVAMALIENIQRENLNPLEEARALERLVNEFSLTHQAAGEAVGRSRVAVSNLLRLLDLADEVKALLARRELEMGHGRALLGLANRGQQVEIAQLVVKKRLSVRDTEAMVRRLVGPARAPAPPGPVDADVRRLETELGERLGTQVKFKPTGRNGAGELVIQYASLEALDGILARIH